jgi:hypothetical protein
MKRTSQPLAVASTRATGVPWSNCRPDGGFEEAPAQHSAERGLFAQEPGRKGLTVFQDELASSWCRKIGFEHPIITPYQHLNP